MGNKEVKYIQLDTKSFIEICHENQSLKHEIELLKHHVETLQLNAKKMSGELRTLRSRAGVVQDMREWRFRESLIDKITSVDIILEENKKLLKENKELQEKLESIAFHDLDVEKQ